MEYMTGPKGNLQCDLSLALKVHGGVVGCSAQDISLVLPGGLDRRPDVAFWAVRPTQAQRDQPDSPGSLCPPPNLWVEVCDLPEHECIFIDYDRFVELRATILQLLLPRYKTTSSQPLEPIALSSSSCLRITTPTQNTTHESDWPTPSCCLWMQQFHLLCLRDALFRQWRLVLTFIIQ